jgi:ethanolamine utilization protein EutP (predicted NTPase)
MSFIQTGVQEIDDSATFSSYTIQLNVGDGTGIYQNKEIVYQALDSTEANATVVAVVQEWNKKANTLNVTNIAGEFIPNRNIIGASSNASYVFSQFRSIKR